MTNYSEELWKRIPDFPSYEISNFGRVHNLYLDTIMKTSKTIFGHVKISLVSDWDHMRYTRSVAQLVAEAFVEPPNDFCDHVVVLDGDFSNLSAENLAWRPNWFAWKYTRQLKIIQPVHYQNLVVKNVRTGDRYSSIITAGMVEGLLFDDIWRSTYTGDAIFPNGGIFEIVQ